MGQTRYKYTQFARATGGAGAVYRKDCPPGIWDWSMYADENLVHQKVCLRPSNHMAMSAILPARGQLVGLDRDKIHVGRFIALFRLSILARTISVCLAAQLA